MAGEAALILKRIWKAEAGDAAEPNYPRIVKESNNNVREALNRLETLFLAL
jgi:hypothetical protein